MDRYAKQRKKMVDSQIRSRGVRDERVLRAMEKIPRHLFIDEGLIDQAYNDNPLPIGEKQTISQPYIVALMTEALELNGRDKVLELGTGSGYEAAILAELADRVFTIERIASLAQKARKLLESLNYYNVVIRVGDGTYGWREESPFDAIVVVGGLAVDTPDAGGAAGHWRASRDPRREPLFAEPDQADPPLRESGRCEKRGPRRMPVCEPDRGAWLEGRTINNR